MAERNRQRDRFALAARQLQRALRAKGRRGSGKRATLAARRMTLALWMGRNE